MAYRVERVELVKTGRCTGGLPGLISLGERRRQIFFNFLEKNSVRSMARPALPVPRRSKLDGLSGRPRRACQDRLPCHGIAQGGQPTRAQK
jgi:hypothetical protein